MSTRIIAVANHHGVVRKFRIEGVTGDEDAQLDDHPLALLDAEFVSVGGMIQRLIVALKKSSGALRSDLKSSSSRVWFKRDLQLRAGRHLEECGAAVLRCCASLAMFGARNCNRV